MRGARPFFYYLLATTYLIMLDSREEVMVDKSFVLASSSDLAVLQRGMDERRTGDVIPIVSFLLYIFAAVSQESLMTRC